MTMIHPNQCRSRSNLIQPRYKLGSPCDLQYIHGTKKFSFEKNANNVEIKKHLKNVLVRQKTRKKSTQKHTFTRACCTLNETGSGTQLWTQPYHEICVRYLFLHYCRCFQLASVETLHAFHHNLLKMEYITNFCLN